VRSVVIVGINLLYWRVACQGVGSSGGMTVMATAHTKAASSRVGGDGPYEGGELPRGGDGDETGRLAGAQEAPVVGAQPDRGFPGYILDRLGQRPVAAKERSPRPAAGAPDAYL